VPNDKVFSAHLGTKAEQLEKLRQFARAPADYANVAAILEASTVRLPRPESTAAPAVPAVVTGVVYLLRVGEFHKIGKSNDPGRRIETSHSGVAADLARLAELHSRGELGDTEFASAKAAVLAGSG
jgi:hypothetical protein